MSLLAPLFLLGAIAIVGPIVAHMVRRNTRERIMFSTTAFLEPSTPRLDRRNRIEHPWLLLLRCLAVLGLAAGFARPFLDRSPGEVHGHASVRHVVAVLDESASMQRAALWDDALGQVRSVVRRLRPADRFALVAGGSNHVVPVGGDTWARTDPGDRAALLDTALAQRAAGWEATHLDSAVDRALEELAGMRERGGVPTEATVVVVSDLAEGARIAGLAGRYWPEGVRLELAAVDASPEPNASLHWLGWTVNPDGTREARLRVGHEAFDSREYVLNVQPHDSASALLPPARLLLAPRESRAVTIPLPAGTATPLRAVLAGDTEPFDNTVWIAPPVERVHPVVYWGSGDAADPESALYFVSRAIRGWREPSMKLVPAATGDPATAAAALHLVASAPDAAAIDRLRTRLEAGAVVLVLARDASLVNIAGELAGEPGWRIAADPVPANALLADLDFSHPLFAPFADPRFSDFTRVRFWQAPAIELPPQSQAAVVARFDSGSPAVIECTVGRGRMVVWAGDWTPAASQWVLSSKFVPWMHALAQRAVGGPPAPTMADVGDAGRMGLARDAPQARRPGVFEHPQGGTRQWFALNVPASESRTRILPLDAWEALGAPLRAGAASARTGTPPPRSGAQAAVALEAEQRLWRWLLLAVAAILAIESAVAITLSHRPQPAAATTPP